MDHILTYMTFFPLLGAVIVLLVWAAVMKKRSGAGRAD